MLLKIHAALLVGVTTALVSGAASAHIEIASGPGFADATQIVSLAVGHGCEGSDTRSVRVEIPPEVVSLRAITSDLGPASLELDDAGIVTAVTWEKPEESVLDADTSFYTLSLRIKVPNQPFTTLYFPAHQTCQTADGETIEVDWDAAVPEDEVPMGEEAAPALTILPKRFAGWNQFTVPDDVEELGEFFSDALIVWMGAAAYSPNPATAELIAGTDGVSELTALEAGDEIWVKY